MVLHHTKGALVVADRVQRGKIHQNPDVGQGRDVPLGLREAEDVARLVEKLELRGQFRVVVDREQATHGFAQANFPEIQ